jgi:hypothetical protein
MEALAVGEGRSTMARIGRQSLRLESAGPGEGLCWRIGVRGGVFLGSGSACENENTD